MKSETDDNADGFQQIAQKEAEMLVQSGTSSFFADNVK